MFGQNPHIGMSTMPIGKDLIKKLAMETEVDHCLCPPDDLPLEDAILIASLDAEMTIESPLPHSYTEETRDLEIHETEKS